MSFISGLIISGLVGCSLGILLASILAMTRERRDK
jgi:hypothetical protein